MTSSPRRESERQESTELEDRSPGSVLLERDGFRSIGRRGRLGRLLRYTDITHLALTRRGLWIGLRGGLVQLRRQRFRNPAGPEQLERALATRIARQPGGLVQLGRFAAIDALRERTPARAATLTMAGLCVAIYGLQHFDPFATEVGAFAPSLVREGQLWRIATANFLHSVAIPPLHLALNVVVILAAALLVERPLGSVRTVVIMGAAALGAALANGLAGYPEVIGASGIAMGLVGAALCLELHFPAQLPATWRLPRGLFLAAIFLEVAKDWFLPLVAAGAHLGGLLAGYAAAALVARAALLRNPASTWVRHAAFAVSAALVVSFVAAVPALLRSPAALERLALDLLRVDEVWPGRWNDLAWRIVTETESSPDQLEAALSLAERAVAETDRGNPDLLDTLAEVLFQIGDAGGAIATIDEAIALAGGETYFIEQRRRFTGERARDDRPTAPAQPWPFRGEPGISESPEPGIEV